ncbi:sialidase family protein [Kitasatospora sp. NPDC004799]|uniref:sialidase family protein n=1 Tax=Kitasatospora sp. NPDC004799 TaxID=3154460 RepID=UPI0033BC6CD4
MKHPRTPAPWRRTFAAVAAAALALAGAAWNTGPAATPAAAAVATPASHKAVPAQSVNGGGPNLVRASADPLIDAGSQHATEVEPDTFAYGGTIVAAAQVGRFTDGGAAGLGWSTSRDGGASWRSGMLPGLTAQYGNGSWARASDPVVAYDAKHATWMVAGLVIDAGRNPMGVTVSRSADGLGWREPVRAVGFDGQAFDKEWIVCDNTPTSPYFGTCYIEVDIPSSDNLMVMSVSRDGGTTWSAPTGPSGVNLGLGGQPLVRPDGTVVVPFSTDTTSIRSFTSTDGGGSWSPTVLVADVFAHGAAGGLRDGLGLPSAEIDADGRVYVAWQDCRFRAGCPANDIVYATSVDGTTWSAVSRVPIDPTTSGVDHFLPGLGVDPDTAGPGAKLGLYYYFYPNTDCTAATCELAVGFISSANGGATWSRPQTVAGPMPLTRIAATSGGRMVGDYLSTSVLNGRAVAVFAVGRAPTDGRAFDEAMYAVAGGLPVRAGTTPSSTGPVAFAGPARERPGGPVIRQ